MYFDNRTESWPVRDFSFVPAHAVTSDETPTALLSVCGASPPSTSVVALLPTSGYILRSRYLLEEVIGQGGSSIVFRAKDLLRGHPVAVKLLRDCCADRPAVKRLHHEFRQMQSLSHPGIARVFEFGCDGSAWFISMELIVGLTVANWMATKRGYDDALKLVASCCSALAHAHSVGVLHGDLKPTNVMVAADGTARLVDFGSASSLVAVTETGSLTLAATPSYASPQILAGKGADQRDDVFSLACLTYSILSGGRHPFGGRPSFEHGRPKNAPSYARTIPLEPFKVIARSLSVEREARAASATEFIDDLLNANRRHHSVDTPCAVPTERRPAGEALQRKAFLGAAARVANRVAGRRVSLANALAVLLALVGIAALQLDRQREAISSADTPVEPPRTSTTAQQLSGGLGNLAIEIPTLRFPSHPSEFISFDAPTTLHVSTRQSLVAINVRRTPARGRASFVWRLKNVVGFLDLDQRSLSPQRVTFNEGQALRTLFIPLSYSSGSGLMRRPGSFTVVLQRVADGPALGRVTRVDVVADPSPTAADVTIQARAAQ